MRFIDKDMGLCGTDLISARVVDPSPSPMTLPRGRAWRFRIGSSAGRPATGLGSALSPHLWTDSAGTSGMLLRAGSLSIDEGWHEPPYLCMTLPALDLSFALKDCWLAGVLADR